MKKKHVRREQQEARNAAATFPKVRSQGTGALPAAADESEELQRLKLTVADLTLQLERLRSQLRPAPEPYQTWQPRRSMA